MKIRYLPTMKIIMKILIYETDYENQGVYENLGL